MVINSISQRNQGRELKRVGWRVVVLDGSKGRLTE